MSYQDRSLAALVRAIAAAGVPVLGASDFPPNLRIDYGPDATPDQITQGNSLAAGWDWSEAAQTTRDTSDEREAALSAFFTNTDPVSVAVRGIVRDLYTSINDCRDMVAGVYGELNTVRAALNLSPLTTPAGATRQQEPDIVSRLETEIAGGLGDA